MKKIKILIVAIIILFPIAAFALEVGFPSVPDLKEGSYTPGPSTGPAQWIKYIYLLSMALVVLALIYTFARAGIERMAGGTNPGAIASSKKRIQDGLIGLLILLGSYVFLNEINPNLVTFRNPQIETSGGPGGGMFDFIGVMVREDAETLFGKQKIGEDCSWVSRCEEELTCVGGKCIEYTGLKEGDKCTDPNQCFGSDLTCTGGECVKGTKPSMTPECTPEHTCTGSAKCFDNIKRECLVDPNINYSGHCLTGASQYGEPCENNNQCAGAATTLCDTTEHKCRLKSGESMTCP